MKGKIYEQKSKSGEKAYYHYRYSYRVKIDPAYKGNKKKGKSKVVTINKYLGTAENILDKCTNPEKPNNVIVKEYGLVSALHKIAEDISLIKIINTVCDERIKGISIGEYLFIAAANRVGNHNSKATIGDWFSKTILPEKMEIDATSLTSQTFWSAFDSIIPQETVYKKMEKYNARYKNKMSFDETQDFLTEQKINEIEMLLYPKLMELYNISTDTLIYDTTNFYHYISGNNEHTIIPQTGKSKDGKNSKRLSGLLLAIDKEYGIPLFHALYQGNMHDSKLFPEALSKISSRLSEITKSVEGYTFIFDKGNNTQKNMKEISKNELIKSLIGGLSFSSFKQLSKIPLKNYKQTYDKWNYLELEKTVFEQRAKLIITYSEKERVHELKNFNKRIENVKQQVLEIVNSHTKRAKKTLEEKIDKKLSELKIKTSRAKRYLSYIIEKEDGKISVHFSKTKDAKDKQTTFGKRILFTYDLEKESAEIIQLYHDKYKVEDVYRNFKGGNVVEYSPIYHWTDSKIRVQTFVNVLSYLLLKLIELKVVRSGERLSLSSLVSCLNEIKEVVTIYSKDRFHKNVTNVSKLHTKIRKAIGFYDSD